MSEVDVRRPPGNNMAVVRGIDDTAVAGGGARQPVAEDNIRPAKDTDAALRVVDSMRVAAEDIDVALPPLFQVRGLPLSSQLFSLRQTPCSEMSEVDVRRPAGNNMRVVKGMDDMAVARGGSRQPVAEDNIRPAKDTDAALRVVDKGSHRPDLHPRIATGRRTSTVAPPPPQLHRPPQLRERRPPFANGASHGHRLPARPPPPRPATAQLPLPAAAPAQPPPLPAATPIQKYLSCKGGCLASIGADQPAEVVDDAPEDMV
nr:uncharacterized protein LOC109152514 isoform X1 [Ipomoea batatas]